MEIVLSSTVYTNGCRVIYRKGQNHLIIPDDILTINQGIKYGPLASHYIQYTKDRFVGDMLSEPYKAINDSIKISERWRQRNRNNRGVDGFLVRNRNVDRFSFPG